MECPLPFDLKRKCDKKKSNNATNNATIKVIYESMFCKLTGKIIHCVQNEPMCYLWRVYFECSFLFQILRWSLRTIYKATTFYNALKIIIELILKQTILYFSHVHFCCTWQLNFFTYTTLSMCKRIYWCVTFFMITWILWYCVCLIYSGEICQLSRLTRDLI